MTVTRILDPISWRRPSEIARTANLVPEYTVPPGAKTWTVAELIVGIAEHDTYHTAQIQLLKRLYDFKG